jgi:hypothetical protein
MRTVTALPLKPPRVRARYHRWQIWPPGRHAQQELREEGGGGSSRGPGCPSRASALHIAAAAHRIAAKRGHRTTITAGSGEEGRSGEGVATEAIRPSRPPHTLHHLPPPTNTVESSCLALPSGRIRQPTPRGGGRRKSPRPTGLPSAPPTVVLPPPPDPAASSQTPTGSARPRPSVVDRPPS